MYKFIKRFLPSSLFNRFLLIILLPNIIIQSVAIYIFYERHWSGVSKYLASALAGEISMITENIATKNYNNLEHFLTTNSGYLGIGIKIYKHSNICHETAVSDDDIFNNLKYELKSRLKTRPFCIYLSGDDPILVIEVANNNDVINFTASRKRISTPTTYIFVIWLTSTAIIFLIIAILFMRNQVRSITKLAEVVDKFGRGQDTPNFKGSGALEVRLAADAFNKMKERINRHVEQRTQMLAGVSHDLKTPLTRMKLQLAMTTDHELSKELTTDIEQMEKTVQEYIDFAKGKERVIDANVNLNDILSSIIASYRKHGKNIIFETSNASGINVHVNTNSLRRAITNILDNGIKYGSKVVISTMRSVKNAYIHIEDNGPGIKDEDYTTVFKPFVRLDPARNLDQGGSGLGLAIANDIILSYGGEITLGKSSLGGLKVSIKIPI